MVTKKEYDKVISDFNEEQQRWEKFKIGDLIYLASPNGLDIDYFKHEITEINVDERFVMAKDHSDELSGYPIVKLSGFITQEEFDDPSMIF